MRSFFLENRYESSRSAKGDSLRTLRRTLACPLGSGYLPSQDHLFPDPICRVLNQSLSCFLRRVRISGSAIPLMPPSSMMLSFCRSFFYFRFLVCKCLFTKHSFHARSIFAFSLFFHRLLVDLSLYQPSTYSNYLMSFSELEDGEVEGGIIRALGLHIYSLYDTVLSVSEIAIFTLRPKGKGPFATMQMCRMVI